MTFKKGHVPWNKGKKGVIISWNKGLSKYTDERLMKFSVSMKGKNNPMYGKVPRNKGKYIWKDRPHPRGSKGKVAWNKGKHIWEDKEHPRGMLGKRGYKPWNKGLTKETDKRIRQMTQKTGKTLKKLYNEGKLKPYMTDRKHTDETKNKISKTEKRLYREGKMKPYWLGKKKPDLSVRNKKNWRNPDFRERTIKKLIIASRKRPTSLEKQMIGIIKKHNLPYKYVGDGSFLIGYKNPDFININGQKICIEVANRFHHPNPWKEKRIKHFTKYGWKCLIFFENDEKKLVEEQILRKI